MYLIRGNLIKGYEDFFLLLVLSHPYSHLLTLLSNLSRLLKLADLRECRQIPSPRLLAPIGKSRLSAFPPSGGG